MRVGLLQGISSSAVTKEFSYMLMKSGTVVLKAQTDMKGYTPGQIIKVMANTSNQSGKSTGHMTASLVQVSTVKCRSTSSCYPVYAMFFKNVTNDLLPFMLERELWEQEAHP